jgi:hypothetical protein
MRAYLGRLDDAPDMHTASPHFHVNGDRVYRDWAHREGPSSVPYFKIMARRLYPAEGHPAVATSKAFFRVSTRLEPRRGDGGVRVARNPRYRPDPKSR